MRGQGGGAGPVGLRQLAAGMGGGGDHVADRALGHDRHRDQLQPAERALRDPAAMAVAELDSGGHAGIADPGWPGAGAGPAALAGKAGLGQLDRCDGVQREQAPEGCASRFEQLGTLAFGTEPGEGSHEVQRGVGRVGRDGGDPSTVRHLQGT